MLLKCPACEGEIPDEHLEGFYDMDTLRVGVEADCPHCGIRIEAQNQASGFVVMKDE